ncbi:ribonuclease R [Chryseosolibacter indicus]|uniref:Ribonuclease R n=1 Tax=Chryseosolibacter indicus TaxID=2782351 RepID=A0ABS5VQ93_9BACT|nr:ribonuclease R [Chryseosolibacter indicus]MBT1703620.1 ribonuclease R [Chryseosolibacter indicus]
MSKKKKKEVRTKKKEKKQKGQVVRIRSAIKSMINEQPDRTFTLKQVVRKLGLKKKEDIKKAGQYLDELQGDGHFVEEEGRSTARRTGPEELQGVVDHVSSRFAYINVGTEKDIYVKTGDLRSAVDGDTVLVSVFKSKHGEHPEGRVTEIVKRSRNRFVGKIEVSKNFAFVVADARKIHQDFFVYPENINGAVNGDKVIVEVVNWAEADKKPEAKVVEILGKAGENEAEIHSIMAEFDLPFRFSESVEKEASKIDEGITKEEIKNRRDFRDTTTFTIDPLDAKDFDDALSFKKLDNGNYEIGVHIADVTHYVRMNSALDKEAFDRATSVYLVDRTIPMLPERLSNGLCSLRPNEDKLTFAAVFEMTDKGKVVDEWYGRTIIHSDKRFTYEEAQEVLESGLGPFAEELTILNDLAKKLRKERFSKGAVNFETTEVKFKLDEKGRPLAVIPKVRKDAHKLIEEFMLLANKYVATFVYNYKKGKDKNTFVYRIHDFPDPDKVKDFAVFAKQFGHRMNVEEESISRSLNKLMESIEGKPEQNVLEQLAIRTMAKAKYSTDVKGHFGLAFKHYTHFTSPIRRYPDMMVHRLLQHYLDEGKPVSKTEYEERCVHSSEREKRAADAERASIKYKQVEFMTYAENKVYEGLISGVTEWGIYVEIIETKCEGMIRMSDMNDDFYEYDEKRYRIVGRRTKKVFTLGDKVSVRVKKTDIDRRLIDLVFAEKKFNQEEE